MHEISLLTFLFESCLTSVVLYTSLWCCKQVVQAWRCMRSHCVDRSSNRYISFCLHFFLAFPNVGRASVEMHEISLCGLPEKGPRYGVFCVRSEQPQPATIVNNSEYTTATAGMYTFSVACLSPDYTGYGSNARSEQPPPAAIVNNSEYTTADRFGSSLYWCMHL